MTDKRKYTPRRRRAKVSLSPAMLVVLLAVAVIALMASRHESEAARPHDGIGASDYRAVVLPDDVPSIFQEYNGFELSFNPVQHVPNYVAWELTADEATGANPRESNFAPDTRILGCATIDDYRRSGYDRGHMAPAADMKWSREAMADCHLLTNICPQTHTLNAGAWATLENNCRNWAARDSALIVVCGPVLTDPVVKRIGKSGVAVPKRFFKAVLAPWANPPRAIGFIFENDDENHGGVQPTAVSVDEIERITGLDLFSALPDEIEDEVEAMCNYPQWQKKLRR